MIQIIVGVLIIAAFYIGFRMAKAEGDTVIGYREAEIKSLRSRLEKTDKLVDSLFNTQDMIRIGQVGYIAGMRHDESWSAEKWGKGTFKEPENTEI